MAILTLQKRARNLGRIRIGQVVPTSNGKTRPEKLDRFRLTSPSKVLLEKAAALYGGTVQEWTPQGGGAKQWEVLTDSKRIPIMVPPQPVSQFLETWGKGHCTHRCDGYTNFLTGEPCDPDDPLHLDARPTTRLNVVLRDVEGIGVWRLESKGWNAAMELPDSADFLAQAGGYVEGWLSLEERTSVTVVNDKGQTRRFMVPIIEIDVTPAELMAGRGRVQAPQLEGPVPPNQPAAIGAPKSDYRGLADVAEDLDTIRAIWKSAHEKGDLDVELQAYLTERGNAFAPATEPAAAQPDADGIVEGEIVPDAAEPDPDVVWQQILKAGGERGMTLPDIEDDVRLFLNISSAEASGEELGMYLTELLARDAA